jgi:hypothetical protein
MRDASGVQTWLEIMNGIMKRNDVGVGWKGVPGSRDNSKIILDACMTKRAI